MTTAVSERPHGTRARDVLGPGPGKGPGCRCAACTAANLAGSALVDATGPHRRLQALVAIGWSQAKLGARLGMTPANFAAMMRRGQVTASTARAAAAVYDELWNQPPPQTSQREKIAA